MPLTLDTRVHLQLLSQRACAIVLLLAVLAGGQEATEAMSLDEDDRSQLHSLTWQVNDTSVDAALQFDILPVRYSAYSLEKPSRIVRRLIREAITQGPDFFDDGVGELRSAHRELAAVGRNINQLARSANQGEKVMPVQLKRNLAAAKLQVERVAAVYRDAVERARQRTVRPLGSL